MDAVAGPDQLSSGGGPHRDHGGRGLLPRCIAPLQARPHPVWYYTGDDDAGRLVRGAESNPGADTVAAWLEEVLEKRDPAVAFLPEGVTPLYEDPVAAVIIGSLPMTDVRGLAQLPPPRPPGDGGGCAQAPGGGGAVGASGSAPESSRGGVKHTRVISPITVDSSSGGTSSAAASPSAGGRAPALKRAALLSPTWRQVRQTGTRCVSVLQSSSGFAFF